MKKPPADPKSCGSCESCHPVNPTDEAGYCHLMPPVFAGEAWTRPPVNLTDAPCRFYLRKLNS